MGLRLGTRKEPKLRAHQSVTFAWPWERRCSVAGWRLCQAGDPTPTDQHEADCVCCVLRLSACAGEAIGVGTRVRSIRRKSARFLPCSADFVISRRLNDLVRARSARRDRQLGAHLDAQAAARQPALHWGPARFLFSTMYSTAEEEQQGEPPTPPAYRRPPAQRRWMYLNAHERAPASMKRRRVGLARTSR